MSVFDKEAFLNQQITGASETSFTPIPQAEYLGYIDDIDLNTFEKEGNVTPILLIKWAIPDEALKEQLGLELPTVYQNIFLDVDEKGNLEFGPNKNVRLGAVREALGLNDPKKPFTYNMLKGGRAMIKVGHRYNKQTGEGPYSEVTRVARAA